MFGDIAMVYFTELKHLTVILSYYITILIIIKILEQNCIIFISKREKKIGKKNVSISRF